MGSRSACLAYSLISSAKIYLGVEIDFDDSVYSFGVCFTFD